MNPISLLLFTIALCYLYFGFNTIKGKAFEKTNTSFFLICLGTFWWSFTFAFLFSASNQETAWQWLRLSYPGWIFLPGPTLHACLILSRKDEKLGSWLYPLVYLPGAFFLYLALTGNITEVTYSQFYGYSGGTTRNNPLGYWSFSLYYLTFIITGNLLVYYWGKKTTLKGEKKKTKIIFMSMSTSIILIYLVGTLLPGMKVEIIPRIPPAMAFPWIMGMWYAITRYRFKTLTTTIASNEIVSSIQDLLLLVSPQGKILLANHQAPSFLQYQAKDLFDTSPFPFLPKKYHQRIWAVSEGICERFQEEMILKGYERTIPIRLKATAIKDKEGDHSGAILVIQDLTSTYRLRVEVERRREAEEELRKIYEQLKIMDQKKTDFLSLVSHELRTPLTSILGFARIIDKRFNQQIIPQLVTAENQVLEAAKQFSDNMEIIISESQRLTSLINDVLDITRMEKGHIEWNFTIIQIEEVILQAIKATSSLYEEKKLHLITDLQSPLPPIKGDRDRLIQVVINLLSNAVKFTKEGSVRCQASLEDDQILVKIIDTGRGIPKEELQEIFKKYRQIKGAKGDHQGTGLGLPISKEIILHHWGKIWAESTLDQNTSISFTLPVEHKKGEGELMVKTTLKDLLEQLEKGITYALTEKKVILVVDDDKNIRQLLKEDLGEGSFDILEASDGYEALETIKAIKPHLIILDIQMPGLSGLDVLSILKKDLTTFDIPVIIQSIIDNKEEVYRLRGDAFLEKPLKTPLLQQTTHQLLERSPEKILLHGTITEREKLKEVLEKRNYQVEISNSLPLALEERPAVIILKEEEQIPKDLTGILIILLMD